MADKLLTTISILANSPTGGYSEGDTIRTYFDNVSKSLKTKLTSGGGTFNVSSGEPLLLPSEVIKSIDIKNGDGDGDIGTVNYWSRKQTGYKYSTVIREPTTSATGLLAVYSFSVSRGFPYIRADIANQTIPRIDVPPAPNDIILSVISRTLASTKTAADGVIEIIANGTNTPFTYYNKNPSKGGAANGSGTFSSLLAGNYTFYAKDSEDYQTSIKVKVGYKEVPDIEPNSSLIDNYGVRWRHQQLTIDGETYKTDVFERGYSGSVVEVLGAASPFSLTRRTEGDSFIDMNILYSSCQVSFVLESENQFRDIVLGDDKKYIVLRSKYNGSTYDTEWKGFVTPESYQDVLFQPPYYVSIEASDRLGDLKYKDFRYGNDDLVTGVLSQLQVLNICLNKTLFENGYRVACNIFASGHTSSGRSPLDQTYVDTKKYIKDGDPLNCEEVILDILKIYQAVLFCEGDYWYIVRKEEWIDTSISYVEYDNELSIVTTSSWSPRVSIKAPTESDRAVWVNGAQSRVYTPPYSNINVNIETGLVDRLSITPKFSLDNQTFSSSFQGFGSWILYSIDDTVDINRARGTGKEGEMVWEIGIQGSMNSSTYAEHTGIINYSGGDEITLSAEINVFGYYTSAAIFGFPKVDEYPPYLQLKWSLKIGNQWVSNSGKYSSTEKINYYFFENNDDFNIFKKTIQLPEDSASEAAYKLRFYAVDISEGDVGVNYQSLHLGDVGLLSAINRNKAINKAISIIGGSKIKVKNKRKAGDRLISRVGNDFYFYELHLAFNRVEDSIDKIMAYSYNQDTNPYAWELIKTVSLPYQGKSEGYDNKEYCVDTDCSEIRNGLVTMTVFKSMDLIIEPVGNAVTEELTIDKVSNENNNIDKSYDISSFDLGNFNKSLYVNYLRLADGTPTKRWRASSGGKRTSIQEHVLRFISKYGRVVRSRLNGNFRTDGVNFTSVNVLIDTQDGSKLYISTGLSSDGKLQEFNGELLEIAAGDDVTISAFSSAFNQTEIR